MAALTGSNLSLLASNIRLIDGWRAIGETNARGYLIQCTFDNPPPNGDVNRAVWVRRVFGPGQEQQPWQTIFLRHSISTLVIPYALNGLATLQMRPRNSPTDYTVNVWAVLSLPQP